MVIDDVIKRVRVILDHNDEVDAVVDDDNTLKLDEIIREHIEEGARMVLMQCAGELVPWKEIAKDTLLAHKELKYEGKNVYVLPQDMVRFGSVLLKNWKVPVTETAAPGSAEHLAQLSEFAGIRASNTRPVAVMVPSMHYTSDGTYPNFDDCMMLECYGECGTGAEVAGNSLVSLIVAAAPKIGEDGTIQIGARLEEATMNMIAALSAETLKDTEKLNTLRGVALQMMGAQQEQQ